MTTPDGYGRGSIVTPEAVLLDFELAGIASRSVAFGIDFAVQLIALIGFFVIIGFVAVGSELFAIVVLLVGLISILFGYPVLMETFNGGKTLGRMAVGTRVVTVEGAPVRFRHSFLRALLGIVDLYLTAGTVAVVTALLNGRGQRVGDLVAGTMVIRERTAGAVDGHVSFWAPRYLAQWAQQTDTRALPGDEYKLVRDFLVRPELSEEAQTAIGTELAARVSTSLPHAARRPEVPPRDYLMAIAAAAQQGQNAGIPASSPTTPRLANVPPPPGTPAPPQSYEPPSLPAQSYQPPSPRFDTPSSPPVAPAQPPSDPVVPPPNDGGFSAPG